MSLYPDCTKFTKISIIFKLYNLKIKNRWSDKSFTFLLKLLGDIFSENNELSDSTYKAKKLLCPLSMKVERIHTYPNDCILYIHVLSASIGTPEHLGRLRGHSGFTTPSVIFGKNPKRGTSYFDYITKSKIFL
jgi:hypothetical protein